MKKQLLIIALLATTAAGTVSAHQLTETAPVIEVNASTSDEIDKLLSNFDALATNYISLMKKVKAGDMNAMTESVKIMEKAQKIQSQLEDFDGEMSVAQTKKLAQIAAKMASAAL